MSTIGVRLQQFDEGVERSPFGEEDTEMIRYGEFSRCNGCYFWRESYYSMVTITCRWDKMLASQTEEWSIVKDVSGRLVDHLSEGSLARPDDSDDAVMPSGYEGIKGREKTLPQKRLESGFQVREYKVALMFLR